MPRPSRSAAIALLCALACARGPAAPSDVAKRYLERIAAGDMPGVSALCAPSFLTRMEQTGHPWPEQLRSLRERLGAPQSFELQTQRTLPAPDSAPRVELIYNVRYERAQTRERISVRLPADPREQPAISDHAIDAPPI